MFQRILIYLTLVIFTIGIIYGTYRFYKWVNWELVYKSNVEQLLIEKIKPECLKEIK